MNLLFLFINQDHSKINRIKNRRSNRWYNCLNNCLQNHGLIFLVLNCFKNLLKSRQNKFLKIFLKNLPNARLDKFYRISAKCLSHLRKDTSPKSPLQLIKDLKNLSDMFFNKTKFRDLAYTVPNATIWKENHADISILLITSSNA